MSREATYGDTGNTLGVFVFLAIAGGLAVIVSSLVISFIYFFVAGQ
jgi:hypothetical protein